LPDAKKKQIEVNGKVSSTVGLKNSNLASWNNQTAFAFQQCVSSIAAAAFTALTG
jgi:hypothetical protein